MWAGGGRFEDFLAGDLTGKTQGLSIHCADNTKVLPNSELELRLFILKGQNGGTCPQHKVLHGICTSKDGGRPITGAAPLPSRVNEQERKLKLHKQEATKPAGGGVKWENVAMVSVYQTQARGRVRAPDRNTHSAEW